MYQNIQIKDALKPSKSICIHPKHLRHPRSTVFLKQNSQHNDVVSWAADGKGFVIKDVQRFSTEILPFYFKHKKYTSFVRQLNMYGFHKARHYNTENYFSHQKFLKNHPNTALSLCQIRRKPEKKKKQGNINKNEEDKNSQDLSIKVQEEQSLLIDYISQEQQKIAINSAINVNKNNYYNDSAQAIYPSYTNIFPIMNEQRVKIDSRHPYQFREPMQEASLQSLPYDLPYQQYNFKNEDEVNNLIDALIKQNQALRANHQRIRNEVLQVQYDYILLRNRTLIRINLQNREQNQRGKKQLAQQENRKIEAIEDILSKSTISMEKVFQQTIVSSFSLSVIPP